MRRFVALCLVASSLGATTACTAQDLAAAASVAAGVALAQPGSSPGPAAGPIPLPSTGPFSRPSTGPLPKASPGPITLPGTPIAVPTGPVAPAAGGAFRYRPAWTEADYPGEPAVEALVFKYTNEARVAEGLPAFAENVRLHVASRQHSQEMIEEDYFDHTSPHPEIARPSQRGAKAGYMAGCGENIYDYMDVKDAEKLARGLVDGWMKSPGHRANILGDYHELGVGIHRGRDRLMATQVFGSGETFDFGEVTLEDTGAAYRLVARGTAMPWTAYRAIVPTLDGEKVGDKVTFVPGGAVAFEVLVPKDGKHEVGMDQYDPADGGRQFWPTELFTVDGSKRLEEAIQ